MSQFFNIHPENPQPRLIAQTAEILRKGGVMVYPTDSGYALGCMLGNGDAQARIRQIRGVDDSHLFTLMCRNLSELGNYAIVNNSQFRLLKANTRGLYLYSEGHARSAAQIATIPSAIPLAFACRHMQ